MGIDEKSGQLIECINPEHLYLGSIHYKQATCIGKGFNILTKYEIPASPELMVIDLAMSDSDESWQASEALLKR